MTPALRARVLREWQPFGVSPNIPTGSPASQLVPQVMKKLGLEERLRQSQVFFSWSEIVGAENASHAQPISLRNGLLVVTVDHPVWKDELSRYHKPLILQKVQERVGKKTVRDICFRIG
jgi:predicted nucleic acid-binding Zn ribbon protein